MNEQKICFLGVKKTYNQKYSFEVIASEIFIWVLLKPINWRGGNQKFSFETKNHFPQDAWIYQLNIWNCQVSTNLWIPIENMIGEQPTHIPDTQLQLCSVVWDCVVLLLVSFERVHPSLHFWVEEPKIHPFPSPAWRFSANVSYALLLSIKFCCFPPYIESVWIKEIWTRFNNLDVFLIVGIKI